MQKLATIVIILSILNLIIGCGPSTIKIENPPIGESVVIKLIDGTTRAGVILKKVGEKIKYIDTKSHKPEDLDTKKIQGIVYADKVYDLEGNLITEGQISNKKGMTKTFAYGLGGFVLGAAVGWGMSVLLNSADADIAPIYPMAGVGVISAIYFGSMGSESDRNDAIDNIREERYKVSSTDLKKRLEDEKKKLEEQKLKQEKLKKNLKKN